VLKALPKIVLVTGASGFIGSHLCAALKKDHVVVALVRDLLPLKWTTDALSGCILVRGDIRDLPLLKRVLSQYGVDWVFHLASQAIVRVATSNPFETFETNILGTVNVLEACRQLNVLKLLIQSTDKVYGNTLDATELSPLKAEDPYGASKIAMDVIAQSYMKTYGMSIVIPRSCNVFGLDYASRIIPNTVRSCLRGEPPVIYEGERDSARQYIYVDDEVETLIHLMKVLDGVVNIPGHFKTQEEVVQEVLKHFPDLWPQYVLRPFPQEILRQSMRTEKLGFFRVFVSFQEGIRLTIEQFKQYWEDWNR